MPTADHCLQDMESAESASFPESVTVLISSSFDSVRNVVVMKISGSISVAELVAEYDTIFNHPDFQTNMHAIWDLSGLNLTQIPLGDVRQLPGELRKYMDRRGDHYKAAIVVGSGVDYQLLRLYVTILRLIGTNMKLRLHRSLEDAYQWIGE